MSSPRLLKMPARIPSSVTAVSHRPRWVTTILSLSCAGASNAVVKRSATASIIALECMSDVLP